jgi:hypothetical protein
MNLSYDCRWISIRFGTSSTRLIFPKFRLSLRFWVTSDAMLSPGLPAAEAVVIVYAW